MEDSTLEFRMNSDRDVLEIRVDDFSIGNILRNGTLIDFGHVGFNLEELEAIIRKAKEVQKHGKNPPACEVCGGTPFFPNMRPADKVFDKHLCTAPIHTTSPR